MTGQNVLIAVSWHAQGMLPSSTSEQMFTVRSRVTSCCAVQRTGGHTVFQGLTEVVP